MRLPPITVDGEMLSRFEEAILKEWIITNGLGGYASSTVFGINTRKYHGLLVAAFHPPSDRRVYLAKLDEDIVIGDNVHSLGASEFQSGIYPQGFSFLKKLSLIPFPHFTYAVDGVELEKTVFMPHETNAVVTLYSLLNKSGVDVTARVFPLVSCRPFHSVIDRWKNPFDVVQSHSGEELLLHFSNPESALMVRGVNAHYRSGGNWVERLYYRQEAARGESCLDDCYQPGFFEVKVDANKAESFAVVAAGDRDESAVRRVIDRLPSTLYDVKPLFEKEVERRQTLLAGFREDRSGLSGSDWLGWLVHATDAFIVRGSNPEDVFVIAGYPWFEAWGRDTFVSLPGLMLVTGRFEDARKTFLTFKKYYKDGLIPNFIPDREGPPAYNSADATLWFANAVLQYLKYTGDFKFVQEQLWETLKEIAGWHVKGTMFGIRVDSDGLLAHGPQLTWMDAAVDGQPVTPRAGKAVEVQALWYNALKTLELLASRFEEKDEAEKYGLMAERAKESFAEKFWNQEEGCLSDVIDEDTRSNSQRPNQIIAVALDFTMLDHAKNEKIVDAVHRGLLTPYGLRTLARDDPKYIGVYTGDRRSRDRAYHDGTVWPWLSGPFTTAFLKTKGCADYRREYVLRNFLFPLITEQIREAGLGTIGEIFDGEPPHLPRGCIAQAWSIAEPLRAYVEDAVQIRPKNEKALQS